MRQALLTAMLLLPLVAAAAEPEAVTLPTSDGMEIRGDLYSCGAKGAPGVVALHMYRSDRSAWAPLAERFAKAGIDLLAIDMRGHGDSAVQGGKDLSKRVEDRDSALFNAMWRDALAAAAKLGKQGDADRIGLLGASVGCSVAVHAGAEESRIRGSCLMTPGEKYLGVPTLDHLKEYGFGGRPTLVLSSEEEADIGARAIAKALGDDAELILFPERGVHGTRMFGKVEGVEERIVQWFADLLGAPVAMDGKLSDAEREGDPLAEAGGIAFFAKRRGRHLHVAAAPAEGPAPAELRFAYREPGRKDRARAITLTPGDPGRIAYRDEMFRDGRWFPVKRNRLAGARPALVARGEAAEILIPLGAKHFALEPGRRIEVAFGTPGVGPDATWTPLVLSR